MSNKLIKEIQTEYKHNALNVYVSADQLHKQTEQLNKTASMLIEVIIEGIAYFDRFPNSYRKTAEEHYAEEIIFLTEITGLSWEQIKETRGKG